MKIIKYFRKFLPLLLLMFKRLRIAAIIYNTFCRILPVRKRIVFFESHNGKEFFGNPYYIVKHLLESSQYQNFRIIVAGGKNARRSLKHLPNNKPITTCNVDSLRYCYYLAISEYLVCDVTFPVYFSRREDQKYLNTWHGTPLKTLGRKILYNPLELSNIQRNFLHTTHILIPNLHTRQVVLKDYMIESIWNGKILYNGYPRNDIFFKNKTDPGINLSSKNYNIAFMPTFRGKFGDKKAQNFQLIELKYLLDFLDQNLNGNVHIWVRFHPSIRKKIDMSSLEKISEFPDEIEPYNFLSQCNALITDYSSVMFDFSITRRPIILYVPDLDNYQKNRNLYICPDFLPFIKIKSKLDLIHTINKASISNFTPSYQYEKFLKIFCDFETGNSTESICCQFFKSPGTKFKHKNPISKIKDNILIFTGNFWINGITQSLKNLLKNIDQDRYNFFLCIDRTSAEENAIDYFKGLNKKINFIPTQRCLSLGIVDLFRYFWRLLIYREFNENDKFLKELWIREYRRQFGTAVFDVIVHYSGYDSRESLLMSFSEAKKIIYVHNDMFLEAKTGKSFDKRALKFAYNKADKIAIIRAGLTENYCRHVNDIRHKVFLVPNCLSIFSAKFVNDDILNSLSDESRKKHGKKVVNALKNENTNRFVNVARFSPEKGQLRLIEAFENVWNKYKNSQLFIIGGYGKEFDNILHRRNLSFAAESIFVLIGSNNIFNLFSKMDFFVLSSYYEGLPMVLFESLSLNIPIISTDIPGPSEFLRKGYGHVVENSVSGLTKGMTYAIENNIQFRSFDFVGHNRNALDRFYSLLD